MHRTESAGYTVEISPSAWKQLARLPRDAYQRVRDELNDATLRLVAGEHTPPTPVKESGQAGPLSIAIDDYTAIYDIDPERKHLRLLELASRFPADR